MCGEVVARNRVAQAASALEALTWTKMLETGAAELPVTMAMWAVNVVGGILASVLFLFFFFMSWLRCKSSHLMQASVPPYERANVAVVTCSRSARGTNEQTEWGCSASMYLDHSLHNYCQILSLRCTTLISLTTCEFVSERVCVCACVYECINIVCTGSQTGVCLCK